MSDMPPLIRAYTLGLRHGLNTALSDVLKDMPERPARWWPPHTLHATLTRDCIKSPAFDAVDEWHTGAGRRFIFGRILVSVPFERGDGSKLAADFVDAIARNLCVPSAVTVKKWSWDEEDWLIEASIEADVLQEEAGFAWEGLEADNAVAGLACNSAPSREEGIRFLRTVIRRFHLMFTPRQAFSKGSAALQGAILVGMNDALVAGDDPQDLFGVFDGTLCCEIPPLVCACKLGLLPCARWLVDLAGQQADDPIARQWGHPILNAACAAGHTDVVRWLLDSCGVLVNDPAAGPLNRKPPLHDAIEHGRVEVVELLVATYGVPLDRRSAFRQACREGQLELAQWLVETQGVSVVEEEAASEAATSDELGAHLSILSLCGQSGSLPLCNWALSQGACLNGNTFASPLDAVCCGLGQLHKEVVLWLLQKGADPVATVPMMRSCFVGVCLGGDADCAQALWNLPAVREEEGSDDNLMDAIQVACGCDRVDLLQWLINVAGCGAIIQRACDGFLVESAHPLLAACRRGHLAVARWLVAEYGLMRLCHSPDQIKALVRLAIYSGSIETTAWMMEQGQFAVDEMYAASLCPIDGIMPASPSSFPWLVEEYGAHWAKSRLLPNPTAGDRRWWRRRQWIFGLVTHAWHRHSPHQLDDGSEPASLTTPELESPHETEGEVYSESEDCRPRPAKSHGVCPPVGPGSHPDTTTSASVDAAFTSDIRALLLSPRLARIPGPHTGSAPAHLVSSIAGVCVSFLSDCCAAPGCPAQAPFVTPAV